HIPLLGLVDEVNATYNWWGSADGPSGVGSGSGDKVSGNVLYDPWLIKPYQEGIEISKLPRGFNMFYLLGIGVAVAAGIIIAVFLLRRRAAIPKPEIPPKPELIPPQIPTLTIRCPQCKSTFTVEKKEKPFKVKCPSCGKEGVIR
ncbi:MAG: hypothetical protein QMD21_06890, partial [Candidatus Thermoplasmatota archaeon]|nr:hypothetical protein [Candidatus Thermoplasmatota archaeon]